MSMVEARVAKLFLSYSFPLTNMSTDHRGWNSCGWHLDDNGRHRGTPPHAVATIFHGTGPCAFPTSVFCQSPTISSSISRDTASHSDCERKQEPIKRGQGQKWRGNISDFPSSWMVWFILSLIILLDWPFISFSEATWLITFLSHLNF